jgi:hypothetical protein
MVGASEVGTTSTMKLVLAEATPSLTVRVTAAVPVNAVAGKIRTERLLPSPESWMPPLETSVVLEELAETKSWLARVSESPTENGMSSLEFPATRTTFEIGVIVGDRFSPVTERTKLVLALLAPSLTVTVTVELPAAPCAGVSAMVRAGPEPPEHDAGQGQECEVGGLSP